MSFYTCSKVDLFPLFASLISMERTWPPNLDFYPISNFALTVPIFLTIFSISLIFYKIYEKLTDPDVKSHHNNQETSGAKVLKYQRTAVLPPRRGKKVASSQNAKSKQARNKMKRTATKTGTKKRGGKLSNTSPVLSRRKVTSNSSPKVSKKYSWACLCAVFALMITCH